MYRIYVASPLTAPTMEEMLENIKKTIAYGVAIIKAGNKNWFPVIPHLMTRDMWIKLNEEGHELAKSDAEYWYEATAEELMSCDAMVLLPGWEKSKGCNAELKIAQGYQIPYFITSESELSDIQVMVLNLAHLETDINEMAEEVTSSDLLMQDMGWKLNMKEMKWPM